jgi:type VI secretion system protein ImpG
VPLAPAGFEEEDAMIPFPARAHPALRLLSEYFCYPEKFHFIDLDTAALRALLPPRCTSFTLHVVLNGCPRCRRGAPAGRPEARNLLHPAPP